jgi:hypothetical protein
MRQGVIVKKSVAGWAAALTGASVLTSSSGRINLVEAVGNWVRYVGCTGWNPS